MRKVEKLTMYQNLLLKIRLALQTNKQLRRIKVLQMRVNQKVMKQLQMMHKMMPLVINNLSHKMLKAQTPQKITLKRMEIKKQTLDHRPIPHLKVVPMAQT